MIRIRCKQMCSDLTILLIQIIISKTRIVTLRRSSFTTGWPIIGIICKSNIVLTLRCFLRRWQTVCPRLTTSIPPCLCTTPTVSVEVRNNSSVQISIKLSTCCEENQKHKSPGGMMSPHTPLTHHPHHPHHPHGPPMAMSDADTGHFIEYKFLSSIFLSYE